MACREQAVKRSQLVRRLSGRALDDCRWAERTTAGLGPVETFCAGAVAKTFSSIVTYPLLVIRARMQQLDPSLDHNLPGHSAGAYTGAGGVQAAARSEGGTVSAAAGSTERRSVRVLGSEMSVVANGNAVRGSPSGARSAAWSGGPPRGLPPSPPKLYYKGPQDVVVKILRHEGASGLYKVVTSHPCLRPVPCRYFRAI